MPRLRPTSILTGPRQCGFLMAQHRDRRIGSTAVSARNRKNKRAPEAPGPFCRPGNSQSFDRHIAAGRNVRKRVANARLTRSVYAWKNLRPNLWCGAIAIVGGRYWRRVTLRPSGTAALRRSRLLWTEELRTRRRLSQVGHAASRGSVVRECGTLHAYAGEFRRNTPQDLGSRSANDLRQAVAIVLVRGRRLAIHAGFTACRQCMNVSASGIIHARPRLLMRTVGEGRTRRSGPFGALPPSRPWRPSGTGARWRQQRRRR